MVLHWHSNTAARVILSSMQHPSTSTFPYAPACIPSRPQLDSPANNEHAGRAIAPSEKLHCTGTGTAIGS